MIVAPRAITDVLSACRFGTPGKRTSGSLVPRTRAGDPQPQPGVASLRCICPSGARAACLDGPLPEHRRSPASLVLLVRLLDRRSFGEGGQPEWSELNRPPADFSGRWALTVSAIARSAGPDTLDVVAPDELLITQTPLAITIEHPSKAGTHPPAGTFTFGAGGTVGGVPRKASDVSRADFESRWGVSFVGSQLIISQSTTASDANGITITEATAATWVLDRDGRLIIELEHRRTGQDTKSTTRIYIRPSR